MLPKSVGERLIASTSQMSASSQAAFKKNDPPLIFVVDDNPDLMQMAELILTDEGYQCQLFCDPEQVLQAFRDSTIRPDLLLTDYEMGSMNGLELAEHCRIALPNLKVLLVSGTVEAATVLRHPVQVNQFLSKPYRPQELAKLVRALLAE